MNDFQNLYDDVYEKLYKYLVLLSKDRNLAEDILQETMLRAYEYTVVKGTEINRAWMFKVAKNIFLNSVKRENRTYYDEDIINNQQCYENNPQEKLQDKELSREVVEILDKINKNYREIIIYRDYMDLSYQDIAGKLGLKLSQVKIRLFRARNAFKKEYNRRKDNGL